MDQHHEPDWIGQNSFLLHNEITLRKTLNISSRYL